MAMFSSGSAGAHDAQGRGPVRDNKLSIVAQGTRIVGELTTDGVVKIEGKVEGSVRARQQILVAKGGAVDGDLFTREAVVAGRVDGGIHADERVEVQRGSTVNGDITAQRIVIQEGGEVNGYVRVGLPGDGTPVRSKNTGDRKAASHETVAPVGSGL